MKKYDPEGKCIKCGCGDINDVYEDEFKGGPVALSMGLMPHAERILRTCKNCGYQWAEGPLNGVSDFDAAIKATCDMAKAEPDTPVIEVGDVVKSSSKLANPDQPYEVAKVSADVCELRPLYTLHSVKENITLIRKGPRYHKWINVTILPGHEVPYVRLDKASWPLLGKRYTLTLTEEV